MSDVKVFPIRLSKEFHQKLVEKADKANKSMHQYVLEAIQSEMTKEDK